MLSRTVLCHNNHPYTPPMRLPPSVLLGIAILSQGATAYVETGSYVNPNPRPYDNCAAADLIQLSVCCNDVLASLDDCKAGDLACECCALQSMDRKCYNLCPGNPSASFLSVLLADCEPLNDVNACNIPFKKVDGDKQAKYRSTNGNDAPGQYSSASVVSSVADVGDDTTEEVRPKPRVILIKSNVTVVELSSSSFSFWPCAGILAVAAVATIGLF